jgi:hypothetical protein
MYAIAFAHPFCKCFAPTIHIVIPPPPPSTFRIAEPKECERSPKECERSPKGCKVKTEGEPGHTEGVRRLTEGERFIAEQQQRRTKVRCTILCRRLKSRLRGVPPSVRLRGRSQTSRPRRRTISRRLYRRNRSAELTTKPRALAKRTQDDGSIVHRPSSIVLHLLYQPKPDHAFVRRSQPALSTWQ